MVLVGDEEVWDALNLQGIRNSAKPEETIQSWQLTRYAETLTWSNREGNSPGLCLCYLPPLQTQECCCLCWREPSAAF